MKKSKVVNKKLRLYEPPRRPWYESVADIHAVRDECKVGRWVCSCVSCRQARQEGYRPKLANPKS